jgi:hypothetical protein
MSPTMRTPARTALVIAAAAGVLAGGGTAAQADTTYNGGDYAFVKQTTDAGAGRAVVYWTKESKDAPTYAQAYIYNDASGFALDGWLERSHDGGDFVRISDKHSLDDGSTGSVAGTDAYYDGPGYMTRACFQFTSWAGAAVHCSPAI